MDLFMGKLSELSGGKILDVATGGGISAVRLKEAFKDVEKIIGIDTHDEQKLKQFQEKINDDRIELIHMNAEEITFEDNSFDAVAISNSFHHLNDVDKVISEMKRVLKPGGLFIINEMKKDDQTNAQLTHVNMHHWWGKIDTQKGIVHNETYTKQELLDIVDRIGLSEYEVFEYADTEDDPMDKEGIENMSNAVDEYIKRADGLPDYEKFKTEGEELRKWLYKYGVSGATQVIIIGRK